MSLADHYESVLGQIAYGLEDKTATHGITIVAFKDQPESGVVTLATLGLSRRLLAMNERTIRQELIISANDDQANNSLVSALFLVVEYILRRGTALLRGEVVRGEGAIIKDSPLTSFFITNPSPLPEELIGYDEGDPPTVFCYLVPITPAEADLVASHGWNWFEEALERQNPDIWDLYRRDEITCA